MNGRTQQRHVGLGFRVSGSEFRVTNPESRAPNPETGFTLLEVIIVLTVLAIIVSIAIPAYQAVILRSRESVLKQNLYQVRHQIEQFAADRGRYPESLQELVEKGYLREIPLDPISNSRETWETVQEDQPLTGEGPGGVKDVKSGAEGTSSEGTPYKEW